MDSGVQVVDLEGGLVVPGLVDLHLHGALGHSFNDPSSSAWQAILGAHLLAGTTSALATLVTAGIPETLQALEVGRDCLARPQAEPSLLGVHLEGPYINPQYAGAQPARLSRPASDGSWRRLLPYLDAIRLVTLAPEIDGALEFIDSLSRSGVVVSVGHSGASAEVLKRACGAGLRHAAHLWSSQSTVTRDGPRRRPGLLEAVLSSSDITAELIADGRHLPAELVQIAYRCLGPDRLCLVSDASAGTGLPNGSWFRMASITGVVVAGVAVTPDEASLCGSTSFLAETVRFAVAEAGIPLVDAVRMASLTPARVLGCGARIGDFAPGMDADLVVLDDDLRVLRVMKAGRWLDNEGCGL